MKSPLFWAGFPVMLFSVSVWQAFPTALFLYWLPSNVISLVQAVCLNRVPIVRRMVGIPDKIPHTIEQPQLFDQLKKKMDDAGDFSTFFNESFGCLLGVFECLM
jgi:membrane protein insertase Oxa1/YidC/SpoIIIJ